MSKLDDEMGFTNNKKKRAPKVKSCVKELREDLYNAIQSLSSKKTAEMDLDVLFIVATLLHQNYDDRLKAAQLNQEIHHGRLHIKISFSKEVIK